MPTLNIKELIEKVRTKVCSGLVEDQTFIAETCVLCDFATAAESKLSTLRDDLAKVTAERASWELDAKLRLDLAEAELTRVTAERDRYLTVVGEYLTTLATARDEARDTKELITHRELDIDRLRARVSELDESLHLANGTAELALHHRNIAKQRNAELVAALREMEQPLCNASQLIAGWRNTTPEFEWSDFDESAFLGLAEVMKRIHAIASAESATPAKQEVKS